MSPPSIGDIRRDDELLDALGARREARAQDQVAGLLGEWVAQVDAAPSHGKGGRYARARRGSARVGVTAAVVVGALSMSGMAAAVTGVPGFSRVAQNMGLTNRSVPSAVAEGPYSQSHDHLTGTWQPSSPVLSTSAPRSASGSASRPASGDASSTTLLASHQPPRRVMPGDPSSVWEPSPSRIARGGPVAPGTTTTPAATGTRTSSSSSTSSSSPSSSSSSPSSTSSPSSPSSSSSLSHTRSARPSATSSSSAPYSGPIATRRSSDPTSPSASEPTSPLTSPYTSTPQSGSASSGR
ncbi:hypothetical protein [Flexivirga meconopsidis]|uniref:hypothetical protein n=1 Tax=Flexivirga meconopsidis TaxID=2977121 RepID=UPI002240272D|nr:hypothetical protein [Flexivirga meconopsidis]